MILLKRAHLRSGWAVERCPVWTLFSCFYTPDKINWCNRKSLQMSRDLCLKSVCVFKSGDVHERVNQGRSDVSKPIRVPPHKQLTDSTTHTRPLTSTPFKLGKCYTQALQMNDSILNCRRSNPHGSSWYSSTNDLKLSQVVTFFYKTL